MVYVKVFNIFDNQGIMIQNGIEMLSHHRQDVKEEEKQKKSSKDLVRCWVVMVHVFNPVLRR